MNWEYHMLQVGAVEIGSTPLGQETRELAPGCPEKSEVGPLDSGLHLGAAIAQSVLVQTPEVQESGLVFHGLLDELRGVLRPQDAVDEVW